MNGEVDPGLQLLFKNIYIILKKKKSGSVSRVNSLTNKNLTNRYRVKFKDLYQRGGRNSLKNSHIDQKQERKREYLQEVSFLLFNLLEISLLILRMKLKSSKNHHINHSLKILYLKRNQQLNLEMSQSINLLVHP